MINQNPLPPIEYEPSLKMLLDSPFMAGSERHTLQEIIEETYTDRRAVISSSNNPNRPVSHIYRIPSLSWAPSVESRVAVTPASKRQVGFIALLLLARNSDIQRFQINRPYGDNLFDIFTHGYEHIDLGTASQQKIADESLDLAGYAERFMAAATDSH